MGTRFVRPETVTLSLTDGDTLTVKKRLTAGESRAAYARRLVPGANGFFRVDPARIEASKITAYLLDWTLTGLDGHLVTIAGEPIEVVEAALDAMDPDSFNELFAAIVAHETAMAAAREAEKKTTRSGELAS